MKCMIKQNIKAMIIALLAIVAWGCAEEQKFEAAPAENLAITRLSEASDSLSRVNEQAIYGKKKGMYPISSREILTNAIVDLSRLILDINAGTKTPGETEIEQALSNAQKAETQFKATVLTEDIPWNGIPAELYVDGLDNGYIDFGADAGYTNFGSGSQQAFTIELWVKMTKVRDDIAAVVSAFRENGGDRTGWLINYRNFDFMRVSYATGSDGRGLFEEGTGYMGRGDWKDGDATIDNTDSPWLHIALVYNDKGRGKLYLNGIVKESRVDWEIKDNMKGDIAPYLNMTAFVQRDANGQLTRPIAGYMKHFRIWKSAKTEVQINELMNGKELTGREADLVCAWPFDETVEDDKEIIDLTGKHTASIRGTYRWEEK